MRLHRSFVILYCIVFLGSACHQTTESPELVQSKKISIDFSKRLDSLEIQLSPLSSPIANYVNVVQSENLLFLAGKGPKDENGEYITGKVGKDLSIEQGYQASRATGIAQLSVLQNYLGDLNRIKRIVKVTGMVNTTENFTEHPEVINGFSDLMVEVFGEKGKHARAAVGMNSLPRNIAVEIDLIVEIFN